MTAASDSHVDTYDVDGVALSARLAPGAALVGTDDVGADVVGPALVTGGPVVVPVPAPLMRNRLSATL